MREKFNRVGEVDANDVISVASNMSDEHVRIFLHWANQARSKFKGGIVSIDCTSVVVCELFLYFSYIVELRGGVTRSGVLFYDKQTRQFVVFAALKIKWFPFFVAT